MDEFGFRAWAGYPHPMTGAHQHMEIEFNLVQRGQLTYLFGAQVVQAKEGDWIAFWGAAAHALTQATRDAQCLWLTLPLDAFLRLNLPTALSSRVLGGEVLTGSHPADQAMFTRWLDDLRPDPAVPATTPPREPITGQHVLAERSERERIVALEIEALLRRLALNLPASPPGVSIPAREGSAQRLARLIAEHYREPVTLPLLAAQADLHVNYASTLFRQTFGMTMLDYLTRHRLAHAQRLLVTTSRPVLDIAFASGFQSASAFYAAFHRATGQSPQAYRQAARR